MLRFLGVALLLVLSFGVSGHADTYQPKIELGPWAGTLKVGPGMVAKGHRLWGSEIVGQDLTNANFDDCDLNRVALRQCKLVGATFRRAVFEGFQIDDCEFGNNDFTDTVFNGLSDTDTRVALPLSLEQWKSTWSFKNKNLNDCEIGIRNSNLAPLALDLSGFQLQRTKFYALDLSRTRFDKAFFYQIEMRDCRLNFEQFRKASGTLSNCRFQNIDFVEPVDVRQESLTLCFFGGRPSQVDAQGAVIYGLHAGQWLDAQMLVQTKSYKVGFLHGCRFGSDLSGADLSRQLLSWTRFTGCDLTDCNFQDAVISYSSFEYCRGLTVEQIKSTWNYRHGRMEGIELPLQVAQELGQ